MAYKLFINDREVTREEWNKHKGREPGVGSLVRNDHWRNHESITTSVPPKQAEQFRQFVKDQGLAGVEINDQGRVHITSQRAQRKWLKAREYYNADDNS